MKRFFRWLKKLFQKRPRYDKNCNLILTKKQKAKLGEIMRAEGDHDHFKRQQKSQGGQKEDW